MLKQKLDKMKKPEESLLVLLDEFILNCKRGKHLQKNGKTLKPNSIQNYQNLRNLLFRFSNAKSIQLRILILEKTGKSERLKEIRYWKRIHRKLSIFLYKECNHFDNYVGTNIRLLKSFLNYLSFDKGIDTRAIQNIFHVTQEDTPFITLNPEQLNFLICDKSFHTKLPERLKAAKDIFVFGCTVGLRISDLMSLNYSNIEKIYNHHYLKVESQKTQTFTRIKLPEYAWKIAQNYKSNKKRLFPKYHLYTLNKYFREIAEIAGWTYDVPKRRQKQGVRREIKTYHHNKSYRFCDLITSHTMRRTAITTLLNFGMPEHLVRKISGHSPGSKEFYKYVQYSQNYLDQEIDSVYSKLENMQKPILIGSKKLLKLEHLPTFRED